LARLPQEAHVLDVGSGWGCLQRRLAELRPDVRYSAVNPSAAQRAYLGGHLPPPATLDPGLFEGAALPERTYDAVFFNDSLCHVEAVPRALAKALTLLAPGGRVVLQDTFFVSRDAYLAHRAARKTAYVQRTIFGHAHIPALADFLAAAALAGLRPLLLDDVSAHYRRTIAAWMARLDALPPAAFPAREACLRYLGIGRAGLGYTLAHYLAVLVPAQPEAGRLAANLRSRRRR
jgi:cyclopropane-fatty-acyl-phospholipid synthase